MENRNEKFKRLAKSRMNRIFINMNLMANLSNKQNYSYSNDNIDEIFTFYFKLGSDIKEYFYNEELIKVPKDIDFKLNRKQATLNKKEEKFYKLAESRMKKIIIDISLIGNLSNVKNYSYTSQQIEELFLAYINKGEEIKSLFTPLVEEFNFSD